MSNYPTAPPEIPIAMDDVLIVCAYLRLRSLRKVAAEKEVSTRTVARVLIRYGAIMEQRVKRERAKSTPL